MNTELKQLVKSKLEELHNTNETLGILYDAIEQCSNEDFTYHRDIVFDMFDDNEGLVTELDGHLFYAHTDLEFNKDLSKTNLDELLEGLSSDGDFNLSNDLDLKELNEWVEIDYKRFVFFFLILCLNRLDKLNNTIDEYSL